MISLLQSMARGAARRMGPESFLIRSIRPVYDSVLDACSAGRGVPWSINGVTYRVDPRQRHRFPPEYDPSVACVLRERVKPGAVCLDVGANAGIYVLQLAHWSRPDGKVIAFEPNPAARAILGEHIRLNHIGARVQVVPCAVSAESGEAMLFAADANGMSRLGEPNRALSGHLTPFPVQVVTLDSYCEQAGICPDVLLLDIEGFEMAALAGAARLIRKRGKDLTIIVEMHPSVWASAQTTRASAEGLLADLGLEAVALTGQADPLADYGQVLLKSV